jgi:hypothetical protein
LAPVALFVSHLLPFFVLLQVPLHKFDTTIQVEVNAWKLYGCVLAAVVASVASLVFFAPHPYSVASQCG